MKSKFRLITFLAWLKSTEMFARPSKQISGKWRLVEYYTEAKDELLNFKEAEISAKKENWDIEFTPDNKFNHIYNLPVLQIAILKNGSWRISGNYVVFSSVDNQENNFKFQFAIEKGKLKLLKKDIQGRIEFFGFFNKIS